MRGFPGGWSCLKPLYAMLAAANGPILFLCGDVRTGRGIDWILLHPGGHSRHETYAREYVALAGDANGPVV